MKNKYIDHHNTTLYNNDLLCYMFHIYNMLRKYTQHIMEERAHFLQIVLQSSICTFSSGLKFVATSIRSSLDISLIMIPWGRNM